MNYADLIQRLRNGTRLPMIQALMNEAADVIEELSAADVESVVRCKDCVHYIRGMLFGDMVCDYHLMHQYHAEPNEYCFHGKKREEDQCMKN